MHRKYLVHHRTGELYHVLMHRSKMKVNGEWRDSVVYARTANPQIAFVRSVEDFEEKFIKVPDFLKHQEVSNGQANL